MDPNRFDDLLRRCERSAVHLETRDGYMRTDPAFIDWQGGHRLDPVARWPEWGAMLAEAISRGVVVRRARIISEPISDYVRFEYDITDGLNITAGEDVRWLPRRRATAVPLPGNDFWLFDDRLLLVNHFDGNGEPTAPELTEDQETVRLCSAAFETVWDRAVPHSEYRPA
ncbi:hypothetical protein OG294_09700 [Kitasatospora sp. NBC_01302]|nr:DUF6879 family protein [Kitasatospora sp. NBC_01302]WSJ71810.1 hypothetical protein OG294_09700 [Kitasatospora sp. NBC_01302]